MLRRKKVYFYQKNESPACKPPYLLREGGLKRARISELEDTPLYSKGTTPAVA